MLAEQRDPQVSLYVHRGDEVHRESAMTDYDDYYHRLGAARTCRPPPSRRSATSSRSTSRSSQAGDEIVSIHLSGGISGTVRSAEQAREQLGEDAERVHVIDSDDGLRRRGLVLLAAAAARVRRGRARPSWRAPARRARA